LELLISEIDRRLHTANTHGLNSPVAKSGRVWVTRKGFGVDRFASARLIRRLIDPEGSFRFVGTTACSHRPEKIRFDMFEG
jgi:hypothetical protein